MGVNDRDILDFLRSKDNATCQLDELWDILKNKPDITLDRVINDIENLENDGLLTFDKDSETLTLLPKANRLVVTIAPDSRR